MDRRLHQQEQVKGRPVLPDEEQEAGRQNQDQEDQNPGAAVEPLKGLKERAIDSIEIELKKHHANVSRNHGYYDICVGDTSYVIFPNQQQLNTLLHLHSDVACRTCKSTKVVCVLTAAEYLEESVTTPSNLIVKTMDDSVSALVT